MVNTSDVLIWGADLPWPQLKPRLESKLPVGQIKIRRAGLTRMGESMIGYIQNELGYNVFADAKIIGTPDELVENAELYLPYSPWMLNCMAGGCSTGIMEHENPNKIDGLKRFADACHKVGTKPCAVTVLTTKPEDMVRYEFGRSTIDQVMAYAELLLQAGFTDIVCSPQEVEAIRSDSRFDCMELNTPGVRLLGSDAGEQARVTTPFAAIQAGATRLVMSSELTKDFETTWRRIDDNLNGR